MNNKLSLWDISNSIVEISDKIETQQGELIDLDDGLLEQLTYLLEKKTDDCIDFLDQQKSLITLAKDKIKDYQSYVKTRENKIKSFEKYIIACLERGGVKKFKTDLHTISIRKPVKVVNIYDEQAIPSAFKTVETIIKISKAELKKNLKDCEIAGAELIDSDKKSLTIKKRGV